MTIQFLKIIMGSSIIGIITIFSILFLLVRQDAIKENEKEKNQKK